MTEIELLQDIQAQCIAIQWQTFSLWVMLSFLIIYTLIRNHYER